MVTTIEMTPLKKDPGQLIEHDEGLAMMDSRKRRDPLRLKYWKERVPAGNAYRANALLNAKYQISYEVQQQLMEVAKSHMAILLTKDKNQAYLAVLDSLEVACVLGPNPFETEAGFRPIEEFTQVQCAWFLHRAVPSSQGSKTAWIRLQLFCFMVGIVQLTISAVIFVDIAFCSHNFLVFKERDKLFEWDEMISPGASLRAGMITFVGMALLSMFLMIMSGYASREDLNISFGSRIPLDTFWVFVGNVVNAWVVLILSAAVWLQLWNRHEPFWMVVDIMGMIFVLTLDDFSAEVSSFLGTSEAMFEEDIINFAVCLTHLPIDVKDLINPNATCASDLWQIRYDAKGDLLNARSGNLCQCRFKPQSGEDQYEPRRFVYRSMTTGLRNCPGLPHKLLRCMWGIVMWLVFAYQFIAVPSWYLFNKPCYPKNFIDADADGEITARDELTQNGGLGGLG